jgi:hypothetical protein
MVSPEYVTEVNKLLKQYHEGLLTVDQLVKKRNKVKKEYIQRTGDNMSNMNLYANAQNPYQDFTKYPRLLAICSAGLLRSLRRVLY